MPSRIPEELSSDFAVISNDVTYLYLRWNIFTDLYATNDARWRLLFRTAGTFFDQLRLLLIDDVLLGLSRLTDPVGTASRSNVVLAGLPNSIQRVGDTELAEKIRHDLTGLTRMCSSFRTLRNKTIAHRDRAAATSEGALPGVSIDMIDGALDAVASLLNGIEYHYTRSTTTYHHPMVSGGSRELILALKQAADYDNIVREGLVARTRLESSDFGDA